MFIRYHFFEQLNFSLANSFFISFPFVTEIINEDSDLGKLKALSFGRKEKNEKKKEQETKIETNEIKENETKIDT